MEWAVNTIFIMRRFGLTENRHTEGDDHIAIVAELGT